MIKFVIESNLEICIAVSHYPMTWLNGGYHFVLKVWQ